jgi:hypothetical protein
MKIGGCLRIGLLWFGLFATPPLSRADDAPVKIAQDSEITAIFSGNTLYGQMPDGSRWIEYYSEAGASAYREDRETCAGRWRVSGNTACFMYQFANNGEPNCFNIWRSGKDILFVVADSDPSRKDDIEVIDRIVAGDPEHLMATISGSCR